jgi:hypothetical protein
MKSIIVAVALLLSASVANATSINFFLFLQESPTLVDVGTYTITDGKISAFHVVVGGCFNAQAECNFNGTGGADPFDGIPSDTVFNNVFSPPRNGGNESVLHLFESQGPPIFAHQFTTHTVGSFDPSGTYFAVATAEPTTLWLLLVGSLSLLWMKPKR